MNKHFKLALLHSVSGPVLARATPSLCLPLKVTAAWAVDWPDDVAPRRRRIRTVRTKSIRSYERQEKR